MFISTVATTHNSTKVHHFRDLVDSINMYVHAVRARIDTSGWVWSSKMAAAVINFINDVTCNGSIGTAPQEVYTILYSGLAY